MASEETLTSTKPFYCTKRSIVEECYKNILHTKKKMVLLRTSLFTKRFLWGTQYVYFVALLRKPLSVKFIFAEKF